MESLEARLHDVRLGTMETQESETEKDPAIERKETKVRVSVPESGITKKLKTLSINALRRTSTHVDKPLGSAKTKLFEMKGLGKSEEKLNLTYEEQAVDIKKKSEALKRDRRTVRAYVCNPRQRLIEQERQSTSYSALVKEEK